MVGFAAPDKPRGIYALGRDGELKPSDPISRLDGLCEMYNGAIPTGTGRGDARRASERDSREGFRARQFLRPRHHRLRADLVKGEVRRDAGPLDPSAPPTGQEILRGPRACVSHITPR